jgi:hypothetical protein
MNNIVPNGCHKFLVYKAEDIDNSLSDEQIRNFNNIVDTYEEYRISKGKSLDNEYIVINTDEPYIQDIINILQKNGHWD